LLEPNLIYDVEERVILKKLVTYVTHRTI